MIMPISQVRAAGLTQARGPPQVTRPAAVSRDVSLLICSSRSLQDRPPLSGRSPSHPDGQDFHAAWLPGPISQSDAQPAREPQSLGTRRAGEQGAG